MVMRVDCVGRSCAFRLRRQSGWPCLGYGGRHYTTPSSSVSRSTLTRQEEAVFDWLFRSLLQQQPTYRPVIPPLKRPAQDRPLPLDIAAIADRAATLTHDTSTTQQQQLTRHKGKPILPAEESRIRATTTFERLRERLSYSVRVSDGVLVGWVRETVLGPMFGGNGYMEGDEVGECLPYLFSDALRILSIPRTRSGGSSGFDDPLAALALYDTLHPPSTPSEGLIAPRPGDFRPLATMVTPALLATLLYARTRVVSGFGELGALARTLEDVRTFGWFPLPRSSEFSCLAWEILDAADDKSRDPHKSPSITRLDQLVRTASPSDALATAPTPHSRLTKLLSMMHAAAESRQST
ncbi:hypothetical protein PYCC9005_003846 [Savitreella phatthalungensis]